MQSTIRHNSILGFGLLRKLVDVGERQVYSFYPFVNYNLEGLEDRSANSIN